MQVYKNILIIGTSHIAKGSVKTITEKFNELNPDVVCVELDFKRLYSLSTNQKPNYSLKGIKKYGFQGYLFAIIGGFIQQKLGNIVGIKPGSDMLTAVNLAKQNNKKLELIDQDIEITLRNFSKNFTFKEKIRLILDIFRAPFSKKLKINLHDVPESEIIGALMKQLKLRYPNMYKSIVEDRNHIMAKNIYKIMNSNVDKKILVVIGAGHEEDMLKLIQKEFNKRDRIK